MAVRLEHANLTVRDVEGTIRFLQTAFPEFRVRIAGSIADSAPTLGRSEIDRLLRFRFRGVRLLHRPRRTRGETFGGSHRAAQKRVGV
jgi:hypothetical protein